MSHGHSAIDLTPRIEQDGSHTESEFPMSQPPITNRIVSASLLAFTATISIGDVLADYADTVLADRPIAYWRMDDAGGSQITDSSGNGHHGEVDGNEGSITFGADGLVPSETDNGSIQLAGFDRIIVPGFEKIGEFGYSAEYWVRVTAYPDACCDNLVGDGESAGDFFMMNYLLGPGQGDDGAIRPHFSFGNSPVSLSTATPDVLELDTVYHVVTTWDATNPDNNNGKIYINGAEVLSGNVSSNVPPPGDTGDNAIYIGRDDREDRPSNFDIDEVALYDRPLTAVQVQAHYQAGLANYSDVVLEDSPTAYWRLDDPDGTEVKDSSGNEHHGAVDGNEGSIVFSSEGLVPSDARNGSIRLAGRDRILIPGFEKIGEAGYSVEYWVRVTAYPQACCDSLVSDGESAGDFFMMNYLLGPGQGDDGAIRPHFGAANAPVALSTTAPDVLALDTVYHVVTTWDAANPNDNNGKIYLNGAEVLSGNVSGNVPPPGDTGDNAIYIGRDGREDRPSNFDIDEIALYNYPLTADQVARHFAAGGGAGLLPPPPPDQPHPDPGNISDVPDGLTHYFDFDEAAGEVEGFTFNFAYDRVGDIEGTFSGRASRVPGLVGIGAASFDNSGGIGINLGADGFETTTGITVEMVFQSEWTGDNYDEFFRKEDGGERILLSYQNDGNNGGANPPVEAGIPVLSFGLNVDGVYGELDMPLDGSNNAGLSVEDIADGQTHHIAATYDSASGDKSIWIDGVQAWTVNLGEGAEIISGGSAAAWIGSDRGGEPFTGIIDEFAFWERALSAEEIATHAANGLAGETILAPGTPGAGFVFTAFRLNSETLEVSATFRSSPGVTYASEISTDLQNWREINDGIESEGAETSFVQAIAPFLPGGDPESMRQAYIRVRRAQ